MFKFFFHIKNVIAFMRLPRSHRRLTFYSEGQNYWPHLEGLVKEVLATSDMHVTYVSSNSNDPGLNLKHPNYSAFEIDEGFVRNWFFENIDTGVMVMSMPDINCYQVKRSKLNVHYVYVQHSLVSLHMVYRTGAFDFYDTIFCAGPHHIEEMRAIEKARGLQNKNLVEHGYARLDSILDQAESRFSAAAMSDAKSDDPLHVLIAPSWGADGTIESGLGKSIVTSLLSQGIKVTLRPHPQTLIFYRNQVDSIIETHKENSLFFYELNVAGQDSLHDSDIMVSDWSGAALEYAFGLKKPVLFVDVPRKVNNNDYQEIEIEPMEVGIRSKIGAIIDPNDVDVKQVSEIDFDRFDDVVFNRRKSNKVGAHELIKICEGLFV